MSRSLLNSATCGCCGRLVPRKRGKRRFCGRRCASAVVRTAAKALPERLPVSARPAGWGLCK